MTAEALLFELLTANDVEFGIGSVLRNLPDGSQALAKQVNLSSLARYKTQTWDPSSISAGSLEALNVTVVGARAGDMVLVTHSALLTNSTVEDYMVLRGRVTADDTVRVILQNTHGSTAFNLGSGTLRVLVFNIPSSEA